MKPALLCLLAYLYGANPPQKAWSGAEILTQMDVSYDLMVLAATESAMDYTAISPAGAVGLFQIMPVCEKHMNELHGLQLNRRNAVDNYLIGMLYWDWLLDRTDGDLVKTLVSYNWGLGNASRWAGDIDRLPAETQSYIKRYKRIHNVCNSPTRED